MYTRRVHRPRELRPRHSVENQWDLLPAIDATLHDAGRSRARCAWRCPSSAEAIATIDRRLRRGRRRRRTIASSSAARERRQSLPAMAGIVVRRARGRPRRPARRADGCSSPAARPTTTAAARVVADAQARAGASAARIVDAEGWSLDGTARGGRPRGALHRRRQRSAAHRRHVATCRSSASTVRRSPERSAPWRSPRLPTVSVDAGALPCRPCDQRVCVTADFRCLSGIPASRVLREAERLLAEQVTTPSPVPGS